MNELLRSFTVQTPLGGVFPYIHPKFLRGGVLTPNAPRGLFSSSLRRVIYIPGIYIVTRMRNDIYCKRCKLKQSVLQKYFLLDLFILIYPRQGLCFVHSRRGVLRCFSTGALKFQENNLEEKFLEPSRGFCKVSYWRIFFSVNPTEGFCFYPLEGF